MLAATEDVVAGFVADVAKLVVGHAQGEADALFRLQISDRGAGMEANRAGMPASLGLVSIKERTRLVKGTFRIQSRPNEGTTLGVRIPL